MLSFSRVFSLHGNLLQNKQKKNWEKGKSKQQKEKQKGTISVSMVTSIHILQVV